MKLAPLAWGATTRAFRGRTSRRAALGVAMVVTAILGLPAGAGVAYASDVGPRGHQAAASPYNVTTRFAVAQAENPIYTGPSTHARVLRKLAFYTPDNEALQTYQFIASRRVKGVVWEKIAVPMRPNGQVGWVQRSWLGAVEVTHNLIVVNREHEELFVYNQGKLVFQTPVGTGNIANGWITPPGHFWIAEAFPSTNPFYGPWAFGTTDYSNDTEFPDGSIVGIHGTNEPWLIPGDPSHGCIRLTDADILKLKPLVGIGTPVWIV
jgi:lipoprotein-anchoring transpeptidase ErfK/SrfK